VSASCFRLVVPTNSCFLAFVQLHERGVVRQDCVNWELHLVKWSGENDRENGRLEIMCSDAPTGKLVLSDVMLEAPHTLVAYKRTAGLPCWRLVRDPADGWGQQQEQLVTVGLFLLVLLGTWLLAFLVPGGDGVMSIGVRACLWVGTR